MIALIQCIGCGTGGRVSTDCVSENNPLVLKTCTVESNDTGLSEIVPCKLYKLIAMAYQCIIIAIQAIVLKLC